MSRNRDVPSSLQKSGKKKFTSSFKKIPFTARTFENEGTQCKLF